MTYKTLLILLLFIALLGTSMVAAQLASARPSGQARPSIPLLSQTHRTTPHLSYAPPTISSNPNTGTSIGGGIAPAKPSRAALTASGDTSPLMTTSRQ